MALLPSSDLRITVEETSYKASVSQNTLQKMGGAINNLLDNAAAKLGDTQTSILTVAQFQAERDATWVLMSGQSIVGSDLNALTGITTLPDMVGNKAFMRQAATDGNITDFESDTIASHNHTVGLNSGTNNVSAGGGISVKASGVGDTTGFTGGGETRPVNYQMNFFIKINN